MLFTTGIEAKDFSQRRRRVASFIQFQFYNKLLAGMILLIYISLCWWPNEGHTVAFKRFSCITYEWDATLAA